MADLAKREAPIMARRRGTDNRDFTLPSQRETRRPRNEINAPLVGRNSSEAQRLADILGVAEQAGNQAVSYIEQLEGEKRDELRAQGRAAALSGQEADPKLAKARAYAQGYYTIGAQRAVLEMSDRVREKLDALLFDEENPATPEDVMSLLEGEFGSLAVNEDGTPRDFGDPMANRAVLAGMEKIRNEVVPQALNYIAKRQNEKAIDNIAYVAARGEIPGFLVEADTSSIKAVPLPPSEARQDGTEPAAAPQIGAQTRGLLKPFAGFNATPTSKIGAPRGGGRSHNGEDFPTPVGTPVVAPMGGKVVKVYTNKTGGKQVLVQMDNGDTVGFAHLSKFSVKPGQRVERGQELALSGNSGASTGPHVHMTVTVDGQKVSPSRYFNDNLAADAGVPGANEDPNFRPATFRERLDPPKVDFEVLVKQRPPGVSMTDFKKGIIGSFIDRAWDDGNTGLLLGLAQSMRADGTPSFNSAERAALREAARQIGDRKLLEAEREKRRVYDENLDAFAEAAVEGKDWSDQRIRDLVEQGVFDPQVAMRIIEGRENERIADERYLRSEERAARQEADLYYDQQTAALERERALGIPSEGGGDYEADKARLDAGYFGPPEDPKSILRFRRARAAARAMVEETTKRTPAGVEVGAMIDKEFPQNMGSGWIGARLKGDALARRNRFVQFYESHIQAGKDPHTAYRLAHEDLERVDQRRMRELRARARQ
ncbi:M23 family metallopeptidase [Sphingopyxis flava]|uniref:Peptidase family M23 n=1 Tax=Sphingopyxis flava TaxID=1507287 RepID=A0A1T5BRC9_9SPHN|nr:M23 family metallopeptidase [Sphingopyxis flava]SKB49808.1 Peptidase family M23 [Sphingopyxis flava]